MSKPVNTDNNESFKNNSIDQHYLEDIFPDAPDVFCPTLVPEASNKDVLIAIDTNALLLPYAISKHNLNTIVTVYKKLNHENMLFLPARVAREFIKNRDTKIAELSQGMMDVVSKVHTVDINLPPIMEGIEGYEELVAAAQKLKDEKKILFAARDKVRNAIASWRGNDPVTSLYNEVFTQNNIVDHNITRDELSKQWALRVANQIPPGFKDKNKPDGGIGDYHIWLTLLLLGKEHGKDIIFVTGETKSDWYVRSSGEPMFIRPELVAEYRATTSGKNIHLSTLSEMLSQIADDKSAISEIRIAENEANSAIQTTGHISLSGTINASKNDMYELLRNEYCQAGSCYFDYSADNGVCEVMSPAGIFSIQFSKGDTQRIHISKSPTTAAIARLKGVAPNSALTLGRYDMSSRTYTIDKGEAFAVVNDEGGVLTGRINRILDDTRGDSSDLVDFSYLIFYPGRLLSAP